MIGMIWGITGATFRWRPNGRVQRTQHAQLARRSNVHRQRLVRAPCTLWWTDRCNDLSYDQSSRTGSWSCPQCSLPETCRRASWSIRARRRTDDAATGAAAQCASNLCAALGSQRRRRRLAGAVNTWRLNLETAASEIEHFIADRFGLSDGSCPRREPGERADPLGRERLPPESDRRGLERRGRAAPAKRFSVS